jgi:cytochrome c biogenesis protein CcmG/thiol:disulfide interchange protein DsbE
MQRRVAPIVAALIGVVAVALMVMLATAKTGNKDSASSPLLGKSAPVVKTTTIDGRPFDLSRRRGSWVALNFFNSTCVPCRQEQPELVKFVDAQKTATNPVEFYTVINDDSDSAVKAFFDANGGDWPKIHDDDGAIAVAFGVAKVPETWIIDPNGFVRLRIIGAVTADFLTQKINDMQRQMDGS